MLDFRETSVSYEANAKGVVRMLQSTGEGGKINVILVFDDKEIPPTDEASKLLLSTIMKQIGHAFSIELDGAQYEFNDPVRSDEYAAYGIIAGQIAFFFTKK